MLLDVRCRLGFVCALKTAIANPDLLAHTSFNPLLPRQNAAQQDVSTVSSSTVVLTLPMYWEIYPQSMLGVLLVTNPSGLTLQSSVPQLSCVMRMFRTGGWYLCRRILESRPLICVQAGGSPEWATQDVIGSENMTQQ